MYDNNKINVVFQDLVVQHYGMTVTDRVKKCHSQSSI